ncbi:hypothetical protein [Oxynema aestuarii]|uniref:Uncharacterized protein n=1 Tax=Oxynema aestuarii AP17 TaxID=2064643 RepID=A0A6H1TVZ0_9CYAN|nr:hypothetical protein [Oxynema aestuarii]QIZ70366.1 hypothetical protein HCG48_07050 [Oxynema aestuarii AP17]
MFLSLPSFILYYLSVFNHPILIKILLKTIIFGLTVVLCLLLFGNLLSILPNFDIQLQWLVIISIAMLLGFPLSNFFGNLFNLTGYLWPQYYCKKCHHRMISPSKKILEIYLSFPEKVAEQLGSIKVKGWYCPHCSLTFKIPFHIRRYLGDRSKGFDYCPNCQELTLIKHKKILYEPTCWSPGKYRIVCHCRCCNYREEREEIIPCLVSHRDYTVGNYYFGPWFSELCRSLHPSLGGGGGDSGGDVDGGDRGGGGDGGGGGGGDSGGGGGGSDF